MNRMKRDLKLVCFGVKGYYCLLITDLDLSDATISSLTRLLRDELVEMCEARGIEVGGTKPVLAKALLEWVSPPLIIASSLTGSATNRTSIVNHQPHHKLPSANRAVVEVAVVEA
jgi:hypothetical protein